MWGNALGWTLSTAIAVIVLTITGVLVSAGRLTPPTELTADRANLAPVALPDPPDRVWPDADPTNEDAGIVYRQVAQGWDIPAAQACRMYIQNPTGELPGPLALLMTARHDQRIDLYASRSEEVIDYQSSHHPLDALLEAGDFLCQVGLVRASTLGPGEGINYIAACFSIGRNLYEERLVYEEFHDGVQLMAEAAAAEERLVPADSPFHLVLDQFSKDRLAYDNARIFPLWQAISSPDPAIISRNAGDVRVLAMTSAERMWRIEATLKLGRMRYDAATFGDRAGAIRALALLSKDHDPAVALAANVGANLTIEDYRRID